MSPDFRVLPVAKGGAGFNGDDGELDEIIWFKNRVSLVELRIAY